jgi:Membrane-associated lipoprotein involved in thiamine biosynthesis
MKKAFFPIVLLLFILLLFSCSTESAETRFALGTVCTIRVEGSKSREALDKAFSLIDAIEHEISVNVSSSAISRINENAGIESVPVSSETYALIKRAVEFSSATDGSFDAAIGPLSALWAIGTDHERKPKKVEIEAALALIDWNDIVLNDDENSVFLKKQGMRLDLGGVGKGYVTDRLVALFDEIGVKSALIDLGGNVYIYGKEAKVGLQTPFGTSGEYYTLVSVKNKAVVTSGPYERWFEEDGVKYHHIFDSKTGYPALSDLESVTIITGDATLADMLSTAAFVKGANALSSLADEWGVEIRARKTDGTPLSVSGT